MRHRVPSQNGLPMSLLRPMIWTPPFAIAHISARYRFLFLSYLPPAPYLDQIIAACRHDLLDNGYIRGGPTICLY